MDTNNNKRAELEARVSISNPDIIGLTELNPKNARWKLCIEDLQRPGYTMYTNHEGRGIVLYIRIQSNLVMLNWNMEMLLYGRI